MDVIGKMKLSIITINYNNAEGLRKTLASVASQTYRDIEHIIVDGGSTDGSVDIIKEYVRNVERMNELTNERIQVLWTSESDEGIYDAMNKGVQKASGEYAYFLNSGDAFATPDVVQEMMKIFDGTDIIIGRVNKTYRGRVVGQTDLLSEKDMSLYNMYLRGINHQSAFIKRELLIQTPYDTSVKMGADWKFFVQSIVLDSASVLFIDKTIADFDLSGLSSDSKAIKQERAKILSTFIPERVARDYLAIAPHYYEVIRIGWLLEHPFWYKVYRGWTTLGCKILGK